MAIKRDKSDPRYYYHQGRPILSPSSKSIVRNIVGRMHVGDSDEKVIEYVLSRLGKGVEIPDWFKEKVEKYAIEIHHANRKLYTAVMTGRFAGFGRR